MSQHGSCADRRCHVLRDDVLEHGGDRGRDGAGRFGLPAAVRRSEGSVGPSTWLPAAAVPPPLHYRSESSRCRVPILSAKPRPNLPGTMTTPSPSGTWKEFPNVYGE